MGKHTIRRHDAGGSYQELCALMLQRLGGLPDDPKGAAPPAAADEWVSPDEWCRQHSGKAGAR